MCFIGFFFPLKIAHVVYAYRQGTKETFLIHLGFHLRDKSELHFNGFQTKLVDEFSEFQYEHLNEVLLVYGWL